MEFCGRCGSELGRGVERGRFCPRCGHESSGNARYPLYADGSAAVTRRRPVSVSPEGAREGAPERPAEVTRPRLPALTAAGEQPVARTADPEDSWRVTLLATSLALVLILVLGILLLL